MKINRTIRIIAGIILLITGIMEVTDLPADPQKRQLSMATAGFGMALGLVLFGTGIRFRRKQPPGQN